jgi:serine/threonine-protein kinase HipA
VNIEVEVWLSLGGDDVRVGRLYAQRRRNAESATFIYDDDYLALPGAYELDPGLPLRTGAHHTPVDLSLFNAMRDTAPDRWGRRLVERRERLRADERGEAPHGLSEAEFLLGVRDDLRQGALRFRREPGGTFVADAAAGVPALVDLPELLDAAARVESDEAGPEEIRRLVQAGSSLGGARPKAHVRDSAGRIAIAKFPSAAMDTWNVMAWEKVALDLAEEAGITVPASELHVIAGRHVLVVDRFDRTTAGHRVGYVSALTMLEARDHQVRSYLEIAEVIEEHSPAATIELEQLWRRIVFSVLISNTDNHLRNHGFLHAGARTWRLSPAFDLNPDPAPGQKFLRTAIEDADTPASVDLALEVAPWFRLDPDHANGVLKEVRNAVAEWRTVAAHNGLSRPDVDAMRPAFPM